jgi:hypothetical protein
MTRRSVSTKLAPGSWQVFLSPSDILRSFLLEKEDGEVRRRQQAAHERGAHSPSPSGDGGTEVISVNIGVGFAIASAPFSVVIESSGYESR